jgi:hypothetical protein
MAKHLPARTMADMKEPIVLFLIGMRINNVLAFHKWVPVFMAMGKMLPELYKNPQLGFKSYQMWFSRTLILVQHWESSEKLLEYSKATDSEHLPAWKAFNKAARSSNAVGIWHETYVVSKGGVENMYVNMPTFGFGKVKELLPATGNRNSAKDRFDKS